MKRNRLGRHENSLPGSSHPVDFGKKIAAHIPLMAHRSGQRFVEKRRHPRHTSYVHVGCRNADTVFSGVVRDVSKGGCCVEIDSPPPKGTRIWLEFSFADIPVKLGSVQGRVAWSTRPGDPNPAVGIEYIDIPKIVEELLDEFIHYVRKTKSVPPPALYHQRPRA